MCFLFVAFQIFNHFFNNFCKILFSLCFFFNFFSVSYISIINVKTVRHVPVVEFKKKKNNFKFDIPKKKETAN